MTVLLALSLLMAACSSGGNSKADENTVRIGTFGNAVDYAPYYVARQEGLFEHALEGKKVEYVEFSSAPAITEALGTNQVDVVFMAEPPALISAAADIDVRIAALGASLVQDIIVPPNSRIASAADLAGARVAVQSGTSSHYGLIKIAEQAGVDPASIQIIDMNPSDAKAAFESGHLDAWAVWPPFVQQQLVQKTGQLLPAGNASIQSLAVTRPGLADDAPQTYAGLVRAVTEAKKFIADSPAKAKTIVADSVRVSPEVVDLAWPRHDFSAELTPDVVADIQAKADFLAKAGFIAHTVDVKSLIGSSQ